MTKKNLIQDVVPPEKKSIRNIPVPDRTLRSRFASSRSHAEAKQSEVMSDNDIDDVEETEEEIIDATNSEPVEDAMVEVPVNTISDGINPAPKETPVMTNSTTRPARTAVGQDNFVVTGHADSYFRKKKIKIFAVLALILVVGFFSFFVLGAFSNVNIAINQHVETAKLSDGSIQFEYGPNSEIGKIMKNTYPSSLRVTATEEEYVDEKASGTIIVYNNYSSSPQKLIQNTRFEAPNGNIYRIKDAITVPGQTTKSGSKVPGSIEVMVYADETGTDYNIDLVDFTIPGFKNTPQFDGFYARSKTAMSGGFSGTVKKISESDKASAIAQMKSDIAKNIEADLSGNLPEGYVYFSALSVATYGEVTQSDVQKDSVQLNMTATVSTPVFNKESFAKILSDHSDKVIPAADRFVVKNTDALTVDYNTEPAFGETGVVDLLIAGEPQFEWVVDEDALKTDLLGIKRSGLNNIFGKYKAIESASAKMFPIWVSTLPDNPEDIHIEFNS